MAKAATVSDTRMRAFAHIDRSNEPRTPLRTQPAAVIPPERFGPEGVPMRGFLVFGLLLVAVATTHAQSRFQFRKGEVLTYHLVQTTTINETVLDEKTNKPIDTEVTTKADVVRKWK